MSDGTASCVETRPAPGRHEAPRKRVLLISYLFPPSGGVGVSRVLSYARYLPDHNCDVVVLTCRNPATPVCDPDLVRLVPPGTLIYRAFTPEVPYGFRDQIWNAITEGKGHRPVAMATSQPSAPSLPKRFLKAVIQRAFCPDVQVVWTPFALRAARKIIRRHNIDAVIINAPPFSTLRLAVALRRAFPNIQLHIEFRDDWVGYHLSNFDTSLSAYKVSYAKRLERAAVAAADYVCSVTPVQAESIRCRYPDQPPQKFIYVANGFEPRAASSACPSRRKEDKFVVTYLGTVYANPVYAPVSNYLDALETLPVEVRSRIETRFIGRVALEADPRLHSQRSNVVLMGFLPKMDALQRLGETDLQLLVAADPTTHAGKLFDYLGSGKPILALSPTDGEIARIVRETGTGWCVPPRDTEAIRQVLLYAFETRHAPAIQPDCAAIRAYEWPAIVSRMLRLTGLSAVGVLPEPQINTAVAGS